jgi:hypothetical protein
VQDNRGEDYGYGSLIIVETHFHGPSIHPRERRRRPFHPRPCEMFRGDADKTVEVYIAKRTWPYEVNPPGRNKLHIISMRDEAKWTSIHLATPAWMEMEWIASLVVEHLTWRALDFTHDQTKMAIASLIGEAQPLKVCTGYFFRQYGLPCTHTIISRLRLEGGRVCCTIPLSVAQFDPVWLLKKPLDQLDPYRRIRDPQPVPRHDAPHRVEGVCRMPNNHTMALPLTRQPRPRSARPCSGTRGGRGTGGHVQRARKNTPSLSIEEALRNVLPGLVREVVQQLQRHDSTPPSHIEPQVFDQPVPRP